MTGHTKECIRAVAGLSKTRAERKRAGVELSRAYAKWVKAQKKCKGCRHEN